MSLTTNGLPAMAAFGNRTVTAVTTPDGGLVWTSWELGSNGTPWTSVPISGPAHFTDVAPAVSFIWSGIPGNYEVWMAIKDSGDNQIYKTFQALDGGFAPWTLIPGVFTNVSPAASDGNLAVDIPIIAALATPSDGSTYINVSPADPSPPSPPGDWKAIIPTPLTTMAPALAIVGSGNYMFLAATVFSFVGPDSRLELYQGNPNTPDQIINIADMSFPSNLPPAMAAANNRTVIVAVDPTGAIFYNWWDLGGGGHGWVQLGGGADIRTQVAPAVALVADGNYMFVNAQGLDGELYINQAIVGGTIYGWGPANP